MADFDLRELSAPLEALRPEVDAAFKRLDAKWEYLARHFKKLPLPCTVFYAFSHPWYDPPESICLEWRKWSGKKRFCVTRSGWEQDPYGELIETEKVTPYEEWSAEQRIEMLRHIPKLFEHAEKQIKEFIDKTYYEEEKK